jgi:hypothetical protein
MTPPLQREQDRHEPHLYSFFLLRCSLLVSSMHPPRRNSQTARRHENLSEKPQQPQKNASIDAMKSSATGTDDVEVEKCAQEEHRRSQHTSNAVPVHIVMAGPINLARCARVSRSASSAATQLGRRDLEPQPRACARDR